MFRPDRFPTVRKSLVKARVFEESFAEIGIGFVERHGVYKPWMVLHFGGSHDLGKDYIEQFADVIISEDEAYCMHTQNKTIPLHADEDELDEIVEELRGQLFKYKACFTLYSQSFWILFPENAMGDGPKTRGCNFFENKIKAF